MTNLEQDGIVLTDESKKLTGWVKASQSALVGSAQAGWAIFSWSPTAAISSVASFFNAAGSVSVKDPPGRIALGMVMAALLRTFHSCARDILGDKEAEKAQFDSLVKAVVIKLASGQHSINQDFSTTHQGSSFCQNSQRKSRFTWVSTQRKQKTGKPRICCAASFLWHSTGF